MGRVTGLERESVCVCITQPCARGQCRPVEMGNDLTSLDPGNTVPNCTRMCPPEELALAATASAILHQQQVHAVLVPPLRIGRPHQQCEEITERKEKKIAKKATAKQNYVYLHIFSVQGGCILFKVILHTLCASLKPFCNKKVLLDYDT